MAIQFKEKVAERGSYLKQCQEKVAERDSHLAQPHNVNVNSLSKDQREWRQEKVAERGSHLEGCQER